MHFHLWTEGAHEDLVVGDIVENEGNLGGAIRGI
jgi:hypothetical protein